MFRAEGYREQAEDPCEGVYIGNADGNTEWPMVDIDDVVYLIWYIFVSGLAPTPYPVASGDFNGDCVVDIDDVVSEMYYLFGGDNPTTCEQWIDRCGELH